MKKIILLIFLSIMSVLFFINCASIVSKSSYPVTINSDPDEADIIIKDEHGKTAHKGKTPTTVTLKAGEGYFNGCDYTVFFSKFGYSSREAKIKRDVDGWYILGNIVFGGLIGWFIVDPATGAMWKLEDNVMASLPREEAELYGSTKMVTTTIPAAKELTDRVKKFIFLYCQTYENKDLDKFAALFSADATENGKPFHELLPEYRKNFEIVESFTYRIELDSLSQMSALGKVRFKGKYFSRFISEEKLNETSDNISMELIEDGDSFLIKQLNTRSLSEKIENAQPQWGPWVEIGE